MPSESRRATRTSLSGTTSTRVSVTSRTDEGEGCSGVQRRATLPVVLEAAVGATPTERGTPDPAVLAVPANTSATPIAGDSPDLDEALAPTSSRQSS